MKKCISTLSKLSAVPLYKLEAYFQQNHARAITERRKRIVQHMADGTSAKALFENVPLHAEWKHGEKFYPSIHGSNCENVVGFVPLPLGFVGPVPVGKQSFWVPLATTEGALVASTNRGAAALRASGSTVEAHVTHDGMTRAPVVRFRTFRRAIAFKKWFDANFTRIAQLFSETTRYGKLISVDTRIVGCQVFMRFQCSTGEAMGMNMVSKGVEHILKYLSVIFNDMQTVSISGNYCADKKACAVNWIQGRGKSVSACAELSAATVERVLKTDIRSIVDLHVSKNLVGSALAGSLGGFNAHAANIVTGVFLATGQDPAQVVESSFCLTHLEAVQGSKPSSPQKLRISVTMPCLEVGTIGGGTKLHAQNSLLKIMLAPASGKVFLKKTESGAERLAKIIASTVLCGELSILAAQAAGHLTSAHLRLNR